MTLRPTFFAASVLATGALASQAPPPNAQRPTPNAPIWSLAFSPDGATLAAGTYQAIKLWDLASRTETKTLSGHVGPVRCLAWSRDGKQLAGGGGKPGELGEVKVWNAADGTPAAGANGMRDHKDVVESLAFSIKGDVLLSAGVDEKILATELASHKIVRSMLDHTNRVIAVGVSQDGKYVATGSLDRTVKIWSGADYKPLANIDANVGQVYAVAFLPPGNQLAVAGEDGNVRIFRLQEIRTGGNIGVNGQLARTINGNRTPVFALAVAQKGNLLLYGGADKTVNAIDLGNGSRKYTLKECTDAVYSVAISPDGATLAAGSRDGKVRLWTASDGKLLAEL